MRAATNNSFTLSGSGSRGASGASAAGHFFQEILMRNDLKILVADDVASNREILRLILSKFGSCDVFENGDLALAAVREAHAAGAPYDILCLDILMPGMNGDEVLGRIRQDEADRGIDASSGLRVLCLTTLDIKVEFKDIKSDPGTVLIEKPVTSRQIEEAMSRLGF